MSIRPGREEVSRRDVLAENWTGWIIPGSGDGGIDFVDRLEVRQGFSSTKLIVLGQAKCEVLESPTSGKDIARTVARLKRGLDRRLRNDQLPQR